MLKRAYILFANVVIVLGSSAFARNQIGTETFNGFEVRYIHATDAGNEIQASFEVPFGSLSESAEFIGRARLLQKMIAAKLPFPSSSAFTGLGASTYTVNGRAPDAQKLLRDLLTPLRKLDWDSETFLTMRRIAKAEADGHMPIDEIEQMIIMMYGVLLPARHAWSATPLGDPNALARMKLEQVRDYYLANYKPENVKVSVRGDFSDPIFLENVKLWTQEALNQERSWPRTTALAPLSPKWAPSLFADPNAPTESERRLYIASDAGRYGLTVMEGDLKHFPDFAAVESLVEQMNAQKRSRHSFFHLERIGNKAHLTFFVELHDDDSHSVQTINSEAFRQLRTEQLRGSPNAAQLFHPARALYVEMGPATEEMHRYERLGRDYTLIDNRAAIRDYSKIFMPCEARLRLL